MKNYLSHWTKFKRIYTFRNWGQELQYSRKPNMKARYPINDQFVGRCPRVWSLFHFENSKLFTFRKPPKATFYCIFINHFFKNLRHMVPCHLNKLAVFKEKSWNKVIISNRSLKWFWLNRIFGMVENGISL